VTVKKVVSRSVSIIKPPASILKEVEEENSAATTSQASAADRPLITGAFPPISAGDTWDVEGHYE
jgi:hypothetical protein